MGFRVQGLPRPSNVVLFGSPKKSPNQKHTPNQKGTTLEGQVGFRDYGSRRASARLRGHVALME